VTTIASLLVLAFAAGLLGLVLLVLPPDPIEPDPVYVPRHQATITARREPGATLDPVTLALPPIEASPLTDIDLHRVIAALSDDRLPVLADRPTGASGKRHDPDWQFRTAEWDLVKDSFFAGQPENLAVAKRWVGVGR